MKNLILLTLSAFLSAGFWVWSYMRGMAIDAILPEDSRVGIVLVMTSPALVMAVLFEFRVLRMWMHRDRTGGAFSGPRGDIVLATNAIPVVCVLYTIARCPFLILASFLFLPGALVALAIGLLSMPRDIRKRR